MDNQPARELSNFEKANAAARDMVQPILEIARRTHTPVIIYRNGKIERLSPDQFSEESNSENQSSEATDKP
jgi:hypothetical protein